MLTFADIDIKFQKNEGLVMMLSINSSLRRKDPQEGFNHNQVRFSAGLLFGIASVQEDFGAADIRIILQERMPAVKKKIRSL